MKWKSSFFNLPVFLILTSCLHDSQDRQAGTSVTIGNPTKTSFTFEFEGKPKTITGRAGFFEPKRIPVWDTLPLVEFKLDGKDSFEITELDLDSLFRKSPAESLVETAGDSILALNLIVQTEDSLGAVIKGIFYNFMKRRILTTLEGPENTVRIEMKKMVRYTFHAYQDSLSLRMFNFLFVRGTPFVSLLDTTDQFHIKLPDGKHQAQLLMLNPKSSDNSSNGPDGGIFNLEDSISPGQTPDLLKRLREESVYRPEDYVEPPLTCKMNTILCLEEKNLHTTE